MENFIASPQDKIYEVLKKIDNNKKRFVLVVNEKKELLGVLTDGDIRRGFINGKCVHDPIEDLYIKQCQYLYVTDGMAGAINKFKNNNVDFLPIVDSNMKLVNFLTKRQMQALLLHDKYTDLRYDFLSVDEQVIEYEVNPREWGFYKTTLINDYFQSKIIIVNPCSQLSLQSHKFREEHWIIVHGNGKVQIEDKIVEANCGDSFFIPKECKHRLINCSDYENLIVAETQLGEYFGEDDIIRYEDMYGRVK